MIPSTVSFPTDPSDPQSDTTTAPEASATEVAQQYLGNVNDDAELQRQVKQAKEKGTCLDVAIEKKDCRKGRIFVTAASKQAVGIIKARNWALRDGDVLVTQQQRLVLVALKKQQVIALQFEGKVHNTPVSLVNLGHAIGNHHWPITQKDKTLYIEAVADAERIETEIEEIVRSLDIKGLHIVREFKDANQTIDFSTRSLDSPLEKPYQAHSHTH